MQRESESRKSLKKQRGRKRLFVLIILILLWAVNVASFVCLVRTKDACRSGELICLREDPQSGTVNYLIAGLLNQADTAYYEFLDDFEGTVVAVNFKRTGWDPRLMAEEIQRDISRRWAGDVRIWALSVGDQSTRWLDAMMVDMKNVAINPCTTPQCLQESFRGFGGLAKVLRGIGEYGLGWLSLLPVIPMAGTDSNSPTRDWKYSPMLLLDQLVAITCGSQPLGTYETDYVILSERDQFLDNEAVRKLFTVAKRTSGKGAPVFREIDADHCGTMVYAETYRQAFRESGLMRP